METKPSDDQVGSILEEYSEIETKPSDDRVGSTQIGQNETEKGLRITNNEEVVGWPRERWRREVVARRREALVRRLREEYLEIRSNPSDDFDCRMLERNPSEWQFGVRGTSGTEFEGGIFHGLIEFPKEYPWMPPSFTFLTENGRFKTRNKIGIRRLNDWQPSWTVRDALDALIDEMPTYPDGELGSVEYNKEERRDLAIKSRAAAPKYGTSERQKLIDEIHEYLLSKSPPVPVPQLPQLIPSQASNGTGGSYVVNGGYVVSGNTINATNSNGVGFLDSMNAFSDEDRKLLPSWLRRFWWRK